MKVLALTNLLPNPVQPRHGIFTRWRLNALQQAGGIDGVEAVVPVPSFPLAGPLDPYRALRPIPDQGNLNGLPVHYVRYLNVPKIGMARQPGAMVRALMPVIRRLEQEHGRFDVIDAYYAYPDGVAAAELGRQLDRPVVITAFGTDLSALPETSVKVRRAIVHSSRQADGYTAVCRALLDALGAIGGETARGHVVMHGVDLDFFHPPMDRAALRNRLGLSGPVLLSVGNLIELKGHHLSIEAMSALPDATLLIAGTGPLSGQLDDQIRVAGLQDRVRLLGHVDQKNLVDLYGAADALVLMSSREGIANVINESLACGTPVLATAVWGSPEVITTPDAGRLVRERSAAGLVEAVRDLLANYPDREATRRHAEQFTWEKTAADHVSVLRAAIDHHAGRNQV